MEYFKWQNIIIDAYVNCEIGKRVKEWILKEKFKKILL